MRKDLIAATFALNTDEIKLVEDRAFYYLIKVDSRQPGKPGDADDFDAPGVREAAEAALAEQRRKQWEDDYLKQLQKRLAEEEPTDAPPPSVDDPVN